MDSIAHEDNRTYRHCFARPGPNKMTHASSDLISSSAVDGGLRAGRPLPPVRLGPKRKFGAWKERIGNTLKPTTWRSTARSGTNDFSAGRTRAHRQLAKITSPIGSRRIRRRE